MGDASGTDTGRIRECRTLDADDQDSEDPPGDTVAGEGTGPDGLEGAADLGDIGANDGQAHDDVEDAHEWHNFGGCGANLGGAPDDDDPDEDREDHADDPHVGADPGIPTAGEHCELISSLIGLEHIAGANDTEGSADGEEGSKDAAQCGFTDRRKTVTQIVHRATRGGSVLVDDAEFHSKGGFSHFDAHAHQSGYRNPE